MTDISFIFFSYGLYYIVLVNVYIPQFGRNFQAIHAHTLSALPLDETELHTTEGSYVKASSPHHPLTQRRYGNPPECCSLLRSANANALL